MVEATKCHGIHLGQGDRVLYGIYTIADNRVIVYAMVYILWDIIKGLLHLVEQVSTLLLFLYQKMARKYPFYQM